MAHLRSYICVFASIHVEKKKHEIFISRNFNYIWKHIQYPFVIVLCNPETEEGHFPHVGNLILFFFSSKISIPNCFFGGEKYARGGGGYATTPKQTNNVCTLVNGSYSMLAASVFVRIFYKRRLSKQLT